MIKKLLATLMLMVSSVAASAAQEESCFTLIPVDGTTGQRIMSSTLFDFKVGQKGEIPDVYPQRKQLRVCLPKARIEFTMGIRKSPLHYGVPMARWEYEVKVWGYAQPSDVFVPMKVNDWTHNKE